MRRSGLRFANASSLLLFVTIPILALLTACGGGGGGSTTNTPVTLTSVTVSPASASVPLGATQQMSATGLFSNSSTQDLSRTATWSSSATNVATVSASGLVTAVAQGTATITASVNGQTASVTLTVTAAAVKSITVAPANSNVPLGITQQFTATSMYTDGSTKPLTNATWTTSAATVATIDATGLLSTKAVGAVTVSAASGTITGSTTLTVGPAELVSIAVSPQGPNVPAGLTQQLSATGTYTDGSTASLSGVTWSTSDGTIATVSASGLVTATPHRGDVVLTATSASISGTTTVHVVAPILTGITAAPQTVMTYVGTATPPQVTATGTYSDGSTGDVTASATWSITSPYVAIDGTGKATATRHVYSEATASVGSVISNAVRVIGLAYPRYALVASDAGRALNRATIDGTTGRMRWEGYGSIYQSGAVGDCVTTDPDENFLYISSNVGSATAGTLQVFTIDHTTGDVNAIPGSPFTTTLPVGCIVFERTGQFAYTISAYNNTNTQLVSFSRGASGQLTMLNTIALPTYSANLAIDPLGKFLYAATEVFGAGTQALLYGYSIDANGGLTAIPGTPFQISSGAGTVAVHPTGRFLMLSNTNASGIDTYTIDSATGKLSTATSVATCVNPSPLLFAPTGDSAYAACSMDSAHTSNSATVESYSIDATGKLTHIGSAPTPLITSELAIDPAGKSLYATTFSANKLEAFRIGVDGVASFDSAIGSHTGMGTMAFVSGAAPVTYTPKYAFVSTSGDNRITSLVMNADGTFGTSSNVASQTGPFSLAMLPWDSELLAASQASAPNLTPYTVSSTGTLTAGAAFGQSPHTAGVVLDPAGIWAVDVDSTDSGIYTYEKVGANWYSITYSPPAPATPYSLTPTGTTPGPIAIDSAGSLIFVGNQGSKSLSVFLHWGTGIQPLESTGTYVSPYTSGSPYALGATPIALAVAPNGAYLFVICDDMTLRTFAIDYSAGGHLQLVATNSLTAMPVALAVDVTSQFVYVADAGAVHAFAANSASGGALTSVTLSLPAVANVNGVYAEPSGKYVYVTTSSTGAGSILGFAIQADGTLTAVGSGALATPNQPTSMTFSTDIK